MAQKTLFLLDSYALAFRMFYAFSKAPLHNSSGLDVSMVHGYWGAVLRILDKHKPTHFAIVRDVNAPTFRHDLYPEYKANRSPMPEEMAAQMPLLAETLEASGLPLLSEMGFEADDVMASVACAAEKAGFDRVFLVTKDKDLSQIVSDVIHQLHLEKGADGIDFGPEEVLKKYGVPPSQIRDYLALMGDSSDNVPGVPKVGPKTAVQLLQQFGDMDNLYAHIDEIEKKGLHDNLAANKENAFLSRELVTLQSARGFSGTLEQLEFKGLASDALADIFRTNELRQLEKLLKKVPSRSGWVPSEENEIIQEDLPDYILVDSLEKLEALKKKVEEATEIAVDTETDGLNFMKCSLAGLCISIDEGEGYYIPLGHTDVFGLPQGNLPFELVQEWFISMWKRENLFWIFHNAKFDLHVLCREFSLEEMPKKIGDSLILAWMLSPGSHTLSLDEQVRAELNHVMIPITDLIGRGKTQIPFTQVPIDKAAEYGAEDAVYTLRLWHKIFPKLQEAGYEKFFFQMEMPLLGVLLEMEKTGVALDKLKLQKLAREMESRLFVLEKEIYETAGKEFNIASPKQLAEILFDDLGLPEIKKRSTDSSVLEELSVVAPHPIVESIVEYREQKKLLSTYVSVLPSLILPNTNRIHTSFIQWGTATGRLSSRDPNLQNIPIRSESGKRIRAAFVPGNSENVILAVDYSQIELRMLAHLSEDKNLIAAYAENLDIHAQTAAAIYGVSQEEVTADQRRDAKVVNFGVLYGMTAFRLARDLKISRKQAQEFIDGYFNLYAGVQKFIDNTIEFVHKNGYVETLSGRRRSIPGIFSTDRMECKMAERMAVNTPVQGSAADLIKLAMIRIAEKIRRESLPLKMMLQVHDELVFECPKNQVEEMGNIIRQEMENAMTLKVPLVASVGFGENWLEAH